MRSPLSILKIWLCKEATREVFRNSSLNFKKSRDVVIESQRDFAFKQY